MSVMTPPLVPSGMTETPIRGWLSDDEMTQPEMRLFCACAAVWQKAGSKADKNNDNNSFFTLYLGSVVYITYKNAQR